MCVELRWDSGAEVVICAAAKHGVNNLPDGSLNRRGHGRSRAETKEPGGGFIPRTLEVRGQSERDKWCPAEQMLPVSNDGVFASRLPRTRRPKIAVSHQEWRPTGDTHRSCPTCWEECKKRRGWVHFAPGGLFAPGARVALNTAIQTNSVQHCRQAASLCLLIRIRVIGFVHKNVD